MPAKRSLTLALALLLVAAIPARAAGFPTITVVDISTGANSSSSSDFTALGGYLYFRADNGTNGSELWRTDGTTLGTTLVKDINANGTDSSFPSAFTALGGYLYFRADNGTNGSELWRTDGTTLGTTLVKDINSGGDSSTPNSLTAFNGYLYFRATDGVTGFELWRTNGTITEQVKNINETGIGGSDHSLPYDLTVFAGYLYFSADDGVNGRELWRTNGTALGTTLVKDINANGTDSSNPYAFTAFGDYLYFIATDGTNGYGYELWRLDSSGLTESSSIPGTNSGIGCMCDPLTALGGRLFMAMYSDETGGEFAYLDEPTGGLPPTNRDDSGWSTALVLLVAITAVAGLTVRMREVKRT
jgi:ELWxxDGT repeat protein